MSKFSPLTKTGVIILVVLLFTAANLPADDPNTPQAVEAEIEDNSGNSISFAGNYTRASLQQGTEAISLTGGAWVSTGSIRIDADSIDIYGENSRFLACRGDVVLQDNERDSILYSNILNFDRETESLTINGWVEYIDRQNELIAKGAYLRNDQESGSILIQINVSIFKATEDGDDMYGKADSALYDTERNFLELTGAAEVMYQGSLYSASRIMIDLDTNEITMEGGVSGSIQNAE